MRWIYRIEKFDGSDNSFSALDVTLLLSEKLGAKVTAIRVSEAAPVVHIQSENC